MGYLYEGENVSNADVALIIAIGSACVSVTGLIWQFLHYRLSGPRLLVRLIPVAFTQRGTVQGPDKGWGTNVDPPGRWGGDDVFCDLAEFRIVNIGRTPTSVRDIQFDLGAPKWWKPWSRHGLALRPLDIGDDSTASSTTVRLDPGDTVSVHMPVWPAIDYARNANDGEVRIRATATAAGRRPTRSRRRNRWTVARDTTQLFLTIESSASTRLFQRLVHAWPTVDTTHLYESHLSLINALGHDVGDLRSILDDIGVPLLERFRLETDLRAMAQSLRQEFDAQLGDGSGGERSGDTTGSMTGREQSPAHEG